MRLSNRIRDIQPSATVAFSAIIEQLRREGKEVIDLAVGEPEWETPTEIREATKKALDDKATRYGPANGLQDLRARLSERFEGYTAENIIVSNGSKQILFMVFQALCDPGDEVIIPSPYWVSFVHLVRMTGAKPIFVDTAGHQLDLKGIQKAINTKTKAILINSPNNPTGAVYPESDLKAVAQMAMANDLMIISDEAYSEFVYDGLPQTSLFDIKTIRDRLLLVKSFSKHFCMTGFRVGYLVASEKMVRAVAKIQSHLSGNVCTFAQYGALAAINIEDRYISKWRKELQEKKDITFAWANRLFRCIKPGGAFYLFPDVTTHLKNEETSAGFAVRLLKETGVAVVPGEAFGKAGHIRISYACSLKNLKSGFERIEKLL